MSDPIQQQPAPQQSGRNGFAITALIFGLIGGIPLALLFGTLGLVKARSARRGTVMSWIGIALAITWILPAAYIVSHAIKTSGSACAAWREAQIEFEDSFERSGISEEAAANDREKATAELDKLKAIHRAYAAALDDAAAKHGDAVAKTAIKALASDYQEYNDLVDASPSAAADRAASAKLDARMESDHNAVVEACATDR